MNLIGTRWQPLAIFTLIIMASPIIRGIANAASTVTTFDVLVATETLTVVGTTTVSGNAFSVGGSTFVVTGGVVGIGTTTPRGQFDIVSGSGVELVWLPASAALRAGADTGSNWSSGNTGQYSVAFGFNGLASGTYAVVGGGNGNSASAQGATIAGGESNQASQQDATVGGGNSNFATGVEATIPGGNGNTASGQLSFAAGNIAKAQHTGAFVWADDSTSAGLSSTANNQFMARATGGFILLGSSNQTVLVSSGSIIISTSPTAAAAVPNIFISSTNGNVGIGTTNSSQALTVRVGTSPRVAIDGTTDTRLFFNTSGITKWEIGTGISGTNELGIYDEAGGAEVMHFKSGGDVGIGTTNPDAKITEDLADNSASATDTLANFYVGKGLSNAAYAQMQGTTSSTAANRRIMLDAYQNGGTAAVLALQSNSGGNLGVGTATPDTLYTEHLNLADGSTGDLARWYTNKGTIDAAYLDLQGTRHPTAAVRRIMFDAYDGGGTAREIDLQANSGGNVGIGLTGPSFQLQLSNDSAAKPTTNTWTIPSDRKLKKDIVPFKDGLDVITKIDPVRYKLNGKAGLPENAEGIGIIAEDIQNIAPYTISTFKAQMNPPKMSPAGNVGKKAIKIAENREKDVELLGFNSGPLTFVLINAIKEQQQEIEELKSKLHALEERNINNK